MRSFLLSYPWAQRRPNILTITVIRKRQRKIKCVVIGKSARSWFSRLRGTRGKNSDVFRWPFFSFGNFGLALPHAMLVINVWLSTHLSEMPKLHILASQPSPSIRDGRDNYVSQTRSLLSKCGIVAQNAVTMGWLRSKGFQDQDFKHVCLKIVTSCHNRCNKVLSSLN